jgi:uncharacterized protein
MVARQGIVPAAGCVGVRLRTGERLRVIDTEGGQTGDVMAFAADGSQRFSSGRTADYTGRIRISTGDALWSDKSNPLMTIVDDDVGLHDMLYATCSAEMYRLQYGADDHHPNCTDNLAAALRGLGIEPGVLPNALNIFMNVQIAEDGRLTILPPRSWPGAAITFRAEMDLAVAISACPAGGCNDGAPPRPLAYEVLGP